MGLEGLESKLDLFRSSEGMGDARSALAGILGDSFPPSSRYHTFFPLISLEQIAEGLQPLVGKEDRRPSSGGGLESFSVGKLIGSDAHRGRGGGLGDDGVGLPRVYLSSGGQDAAILGRDGLLHEAESLLAPRKGG